MGMTPTMCRVARALVFAACALVVSVTAAPAADKRPTAQKLTFAVADFEQAGGTPRFHPLGRAIPAAIAMGIVADERVSYVDRGALWQAAIELLPFDDLQRNPDLVFSAKVLDRLNIAIVLRGRFWELEGKLRIEAALEDRRSGRSLKLTPDIVDVRSVHLAMDKLSRQLVAQVDGLLSAAASDVKQLAVLCFRDVSGGPKQKRDIGEDIAVGLLAELELDDNVRARSWTETQSLCPHAANPAAAAAAARADVVVTGEFAVVDGRISIGTVMYIAARSLTLDVGRFEDYSRNLDDVVGRIGEDVQALLEIVVSYSDEKLADLLKPESSASAYVTRANGYLASGSGQLMLAAFAAQRAIALEPSDAVAHYTLGVVRNTQGRAHDALREFKAAAKLDPAHVASLLALAEAYRGFSDYELAVEALAKAARLSDSADVHVRTADVYYLARNNAKARAAAQEALKRDPGNVRAHVLIARVHQAEGQEDKALEIARKVHQSSPANSEATTFLKDLLVVRARRFTGEGKIQAAADAYTEVKSVAPSTSIYRSLMTLEIGRGGYVATKQLFAEAVKGNYADAGVYNEAAIAYRRTGDVERAIQLYDTGIKLNPDLSYLYNNKGFALATLTRFDDAIPEYDRAIKADAKNLLAYANKSGALLRLERFEDAQKVVDSAKRVEPESRVVVLAQTLIFVAQGRWSEALATYDALLVRQPNDVTALSERARALSELGRYGESVTAADQALAKDPKMASAFSHRGFSKVRLGSREDGIQDIRQTLKLEPQSALAYFNLARISAEQGDAAEAVANLQTAIRLDPVFRPIAKSSPSFATLKRDASIRSLLGVSE